MTESVLKVMYLYAIIISLMHGYADSHSLLLQVRCQDPIRDIQTLDFWRCFLHTIFPNPKDRDIDDIPPVSEHNAKRLSNSYFWPQYGERTKNQMRRNDDQMGHTYQFIGDQPPKSGSKANILQMSHHLRML